MPIFPSFRISAFISERQMQSSLEMGSSVAHKIGQQTYLTNDDGTDIKSFIANGAVRQAGGSLRPYVLFCFCIAEYAVKTCITANILLYFQYNHSKITSTQGEACRSLTEKSSRLTQGKKPTSPGKKP
jgi:hypothetical protein